jgi:hypothetical protein
MGFQIRCWCCTWDAAYEGWYLPYRLRDRTIFLNHHSLISHLCDLCINGDFKHLFNQWKGCGQELDGGFVMKPFFATIIHWIVAHITWASRVTLRKTITRTNRLQPRKNNVAARGHTIVSRKKTVFLHYYSLGSHSYNLKGNRHDKHPFKQDIHPPVWMPPPGWNELTCAVSIIQTVFYLRPEQEFHRYGGREWDIWKAHLPDISNIPTKFHQNRTNSFRVTARTRISPIWRPSWNKMATVRETYERHISPI